MPGNQICPRAPSANRNPPKPGLSLGLNEVSKLKGPAPQRAGPRNEPILQLAKYSRQFLVPQSKCFVPSESQVAVEDDLPGIKGVDVA